MSEWTRRGIIGSAVTAGSGLLFWSSDDGGQNGVVVPAPSGDVAVVTDSPDMVSWEGATLLGSLEILDGADKAECFFEFRPVGADESITTEAERLDSPGEFARAMQDLTDDTDYEVRAVAETDAAFDEGRWKTFTTEPKPNLEVVTTNGVEEIGREQARLFGEVIDMTNIDEAEAFFEFRKTTAAEYGDSAKEIVVEPREFDELIDGLDPGTEYEGRARADATGGDWSDVGELVTWETDPAIPDSVVDNFEAADADPTGLYESGETISDYYPNGTPSSWARTTNNVTEGAHALETQTNSSAEGIWSVPGDGLNRYPDEGEEVEFLIRDDGSIPELCLAVEDSTSPSAYGFSFGPSLGSARMEIYKMSDLSQGAGSETELEWTSISRSEDTWYIGVVQLPTSQDDSISFTIYENDGLSRGTEHESVTATDNDYAGQRGVGMMNRSDGTGGETVIDRIRVTG